MISRDEVQKLADLSHVAVDDAELQTIAGELDSILGYVSAVKELAGASSARTKAELRNVMRDDVVTNTPGEYTKRIVEAFPEREGDSLKVKKIL